MLTLSTRASSELPSESGAKRVLATYRTDIRPRTILNAGVRALLLGHKGRKPAESAETSL